MGDTILLSTKNLNQRRPSKKLAYKYLGPYTITKVIGDHKLAYRLQLPATIRIHDIFPISLLEPYHLREGQQLEDVQQELEVAPKSEEPVYEVEEIVAHRGPRRNRQYKIR